MACEQGSLYDYLANFTADNPLKAVYCPYVQDTAGGAGMGMAVFGLFIFGTIGLGLTVRTQHPGPILIASILSAGVIAGSIPGMAAKILALVVFFGIVAVGLIIYKRSKTTL